MRNTSAAAPCLGSFIVSYRIRYRRLRNSKRRLVVLILAFGRFPSRTKDVLRFDVAQILRQIRRVDLGQPAT